MYSFKAIVFIVTILFGITLGIVASWADDAPQQPTPAPPIQTMMVPQPFSCGTNEYMNGLLARMKAIPLFRGINQMSKLPTEIYVIIEKDETKGISEMVMVTRGSGGTCLTQPLMGIGIHSQHFKELYFNLFAAKA